MHNFTKSCLRSAIRDQIMKIEEHLKRTQKPENITRSLTLTQYMNESEVLWIQAIKELREFENE